MTEFDLQKLLANQKMKNNPKLFFILVAVTSLTAIGCSGGDYVSVSGKVTNNGDPVPNVRVVFTPDAVGENHVPGPYSSGETDENGTFTLRTRYDEAGAVVGPHRVGFEWADIDFDAMSGLKDELGMDEGDPTETAAIQKRIEELKQKLKSRPKVNLNEVIEFEVPKGGTETADFEIGK